MKTLPTLKTNYNFRETRIFLPRLRTMAKVHDRIFITLIPVIETLMRRKLINGFHFILHEHIDLRLSCNSWEGYEYVIKDILKAWAIHDPLVDWIGLDPDLYGGEEGVIICYNNLEFNSRIIMGIIQANYTSDRDPYKRRRAIAERQRDNFIDAQFPHFLRAQFGIGNALEAQIDLQRFWDNVKIVARYESKLSAVKVILRSVRKVFLK